MKNVFQLGAVVGQIEVPSHAVLNEKASKSWRKKVRLMDGGPPKVKKKRKKVITRYIPKKISKIIERPDYKAYIKSKRWRNRRYAYYHKFGWKCALCKTNINLGLHHLSYERLGNERDEDLIALCWHCHYKYHEEHGVRRESKDSTYKFIQEEQETEELRQLARNL